MSIRIQHAHTDDAGIIHCTLEVQVPGAQGVIAVEISDLAEATIVARDFGAEWMRGLDLICQLYDQGMLLKGDGE
jgi:hypothetical protein